jgi:lipopolysaccharide heptosyltransferase II
MKILIRLPNWLGDVVMSLGLLNELKSNFPSAQIDVICKKGLEQLVEFMPSINHTYVFSKSEFPGLLGLIKFGKFVQLNGPYDYFFCLPNSFSSSLMGFFTKSKCRIGYKNEGRQLFLTKSFKMPTGLHRAEEYVNLFYQTFPAVEVKKPIVFYNLKKEQVQEQLLVNFNSEAQSRRMPILKAVEIVKAISNRYAFPIVLLGSPKDKAYIDEIMQQAALPALQNRAGSTNLKDLITLMNSSKIVLSVDSGPAHLANALKTNTVIMHGADDEKNTEAYNKKYVFGLRYGQLSCEPCVKNTCNKYPEPACLIRLDNQQILNKIEEALVYKE